ncbi:hypothetical protein WN943_011770 [Citrus x changshan-huyou]
MEYMPPSCKKSRTVEIPVGLPLQDVATTARPTPVVLGWEALHVCHHCEYSGSYCGFNTTSNSTICVAVKHQKREQEQEYSARLRMYHPPGHNKSWPPIRSIKPFLPEVEVGRPEHPLPRVGEVMDVDCGKTWIQEKPIKRFTTKEFCGEEVLRGEIMVVDELVEERSWSRRDPGPGQNQNLASTFWRRVWGAEPKASIDREKKRKTSEETIDVGGSRAQGGDLRLNKSVKLREIANEARKKAMYERMERMEKHMETLTTILHELRSERRGSMRKGVENADKRELRQHLHDVEQERDQVTARDPGRAVQLEEEVRRLAQIIDDMQERSRAPG